MTNLLAPLPPPLSERPRHGASARPRFEERHLSAETTRKKALNKLPTVPPSLKRAKKAREDLGVDLYGAQQQLANLQIGLEKAHEHYTETTRIRQKAEGDVSRLRGLASEQSGRTKEEERR